MKMNWASRLGLLVVSGFGFCAIFAPWLAPYGQSQVVGDVWEPLFGEFFFGTDQIGRDMLSMLIYGARNMIALALLTTGCAFGLGSLLGFLAATMGGWVDQVLSRFVDVVISIPTLIFALIVLSSTGTSIFALVTVIAIIYAMPVYRIARAVAMDIEVMDYVEAARLRGEGLWWIMRKEILPNALTPLAAEFGLRFCFVFLLISGLSFLGLGLQPPLADWSAYTSSDRLPSFTQIIRLICSGRVPGHVVREEFGRQLDSFTKAFGSLPAYIDGHHHVHQLPIIREIVVSSVSAVQGSNPIFVRNCYVRPQLALQRGVSPLKAIGLAVPGRGMVTRLKRYGLWTNSDFSGVYDLSGKASYIRLFQRFLVGAKSGHLIMCHPGHVDEVLSKVDSFTKPRSAEYNYFAGGQFPELLRQYGFRVGRLRDLRAKGTENEISHRYKVKDEDQ